LNPLAERALLAVAPTTGHLYIRLVRATMRASFRGREILDAAVGRGDRFILAFWHSRLILMPYVYPGHRISVLISRHRDAEIIGRILHKFGFDLSRGSSSDGGAAGMRDVLRKVRDGHDIAFTPDGPRGPRRRAKTGVVAVARLTGLPIIPVTFSASRGRRLRSWDRTLVPRPFCRGLYLCGDPLRCPRDADPSEQESVRGRLEAELDRITDLADAETGLGVEEARPPAAPS
jgi:lysophospholipid acyltransferase (LPLAT)-like uncharacterized protein